MGDESRASGRGFPACSTWSVPRDSWGARNGSISPAGCRARRGRGSSAALLSTGTPCSTSVAGRACWRTSSSRAAIAGRTSASIPTSERSAGPGCGWGSRRGGRFAPQGSKVSGSGRSTRRRSSTSSTWSLRRTAPLLVAEVASRLAPGGRLVALTSGGGPRWKRAVDRFQERLAVVLGVTRGAVVAPCDGAEVASLFSQAGLARRPRRGRGRGVRPRVRARQRAASGRGSVGLRTLPGRKLASFVRLSTRIACAITAPPSSDLDEGGGVLPKGRSHLGEDVVPLDRLVAVEEKLPDREAFAGDVEKGHPHACRDAERLEKAEVRPRSGGGGEKREGDPLARHRFGILENADGEPVALRAFLGIGAARGDDAGGVSENGEPQGAGRVLGQAEQAGEDILEEACLPGSQAQDQLEGSRPFRGVVGDPDVDRRRPGIRDLEIGAEERPEPPRRPGCRREVGIPAETGRRHEEPVVRAVVDRGGPGNDAARAREDADLEEVSIGRRHGRRPGGRR